jgi:outer membrane protein assembly factor BamB
MTFRRMLSIVLCLLMLCMSSSAVAQEWTRFRGPNGSGVSETTTIPVEWSEQDYNWAVELPGIGHGSPVVWGDRLFVQCDNNNGAERIILCINTNNGNRLWARKFTSINHKKHKKNSFASSTPAVDEHNVYVAWGTPEKLTLMALSHKGKTVWELDLGPVKGGHGFAASPIVYEDLVILANDQNGESSLIAVDRQSGNVRWNVARSSERLTYSTPCIYKRPGRPDDLIFTNWRHGITAVDPKTGETNWEISVFDQSHKERAIGSPVLSGELIIGTCGFVTAQKHAVAVRPGDSGKPDDVQEVFRVERSVPHIPTALVYKNRLYLWDDKGVVTCLDASSGKQIWMRRVGGKFFGSPVCVNGKLYSINDDGTVIVLAASDTYQLLAKNKLGETSHSTPAISGGTMFLRTVSHLYSLGGNNSEKSR